MAEIQKPSDINKIWASSGDVLAPSDSKIATGWQVEIPPRQYFNYIDNKQDQAIAHINQHGISVWDSATEYQYSSSGSKSLCMGSNGVIYRAKQVNTNQNPVTDTTNVYWETAFASISDVYSKTDADAKYSQRFANLSDLGNAAASRTNLSVYSKAETYTQSQIDAKTTGRFISTTVITTTGTFTPNPLTKTIKVKVQGPGGVGGGSSSTGANGFSLGGGGGSGGYAESILANFPATINCTINSALTSFGTYISCTSGTGGSTGIAVTQGSTATQSGGGGGGSSGGNVLNITGANGHTGVGSQSSNFCAGHGADSRLGSGGRGVVSSQSNGGAAAGYGSGGGGGGTDLNSAASAGGAPGPGVIIVEEFA